MHVSISVTRALTALVRTSGSQTNRRLLRSRRSCQRREAHSRYGSAKRSSFLFRLVLPSRSQRTPSPLIMRTSLRSEVKHAGLALLLGLISMLVMAPVWSASDPGGLFDKILRVLLLPGAKTGVWVAPQIYPPATFKYLAPVFGGIGEVLFLSLIWFVIIELPSITKKAPIDSRGEIP